MRPNIPEGHVEVDRPNFTRQPSPDLQASALPRGRILLVEDEDLVRAVMAESLTAAGYELFEAQNGLKAFAHYVEHQKTIDAIITDVRMPQMSGWELASRIKNLDPSAKFLFVSAYQHSDLARSGVRDIAFLQKPFTIGALVQQLDRLLGYDVETSVHTAERR
jgi:two-component system, cell cycle sensor histidine kinase and response regulator CckA